MSTCFSLFKRFFVLLMLSGVIACGGGGGGSAPVIPTPNPMPDPDPDPEPDPPTFSANLRFTEFGIPHVQASDWAGLGYGHGYAYATQNFCVLMREIIIANGQSQRYFGEDGDLAADFVFALLGDDVETVFLDALSDDMRALAEGYVAGFNRYFRDTGAANLPAGDEGCVDQPWVREITLVDYAKMLRKLAVRASSEPLADFIFAAEPPDTMAANTALQSGMPSTVIAQSNALPERLNSTAEMVAALDVQEVQRAIDRIALPKPEQLGSNAYATGSEVTQNGGGALFGNPHFPWSGSNRFAMIHLTMTPEGVTEPEYDVMGAALHGFPLVSIGFNSDLAWSHTVSTGSRFVLYELQLNPDDAMQYEFEGEMRDITSQTITIDVQTETGGIEQQSHTFYFSHFGLIVDLGSVNGLLAGWPVAAGTGNLYSLRDINADNVRGLSTWRDVGQASNIAALEAALANIGIPWVNTIAADSAGSAFYGDISAVANVTEMQRTECITGAIAPLLTGFGLTTLNGTTADCELTTDANAPVAGVIGYERLPKLINSTYVANANDSYWLSNPDSLLTGFPQIIGAEEVEQSLRTRLAFVQMQERIAGTDGLGIAGTNPIVLQDMLFSSRNMAAELVITDVRTLCTNTPDWSVYSANPGAIAQACSILANWDTTHNNDQVGGHIFFEFWRIARDIENLWLVAFDATNPINTPRTVNVADAAVAEALRQALADGVQTLLDANIALDAPWGEVQYSERNGERIPIHGGSGSMLFSVITSDLIADEGYSDIRHGNSYMQTVGWDNDDCPDAYGLLSYSQSSDPTSANYDDQTELYSNKQWVDLPFCNADVEAAQVGETIDLEEEIAQ
ncbi:MAG: penicillin acylase family protein [Pseudomonadota bacterium]